LQLPLSFTTVRVKRAGVARILIKTDQASEDKKFLKMKLENRRTVRSLRQMAGKYTRFGSTAVE